MYDPDLAALFIANFAEAVRAAASLAVSLRRTAHLFPLTAEGLRRLDEDSLERLDAFRVRYASFQGEDDLKASALTEADVAAPALFELTARLRHYAMTRIGLAADALPDISR